MKHTSIPAVLLIVSLSAGSAWAEGSERDDPLRPNVPADFDASAAGLSRAPLIVEELGLAMHPPASVSIAPQRTGGKLIVSVFDAATPPTWTMTIQHLMATTSETTAATPIEDHLASLAEAERPHRVLVNEPASYGGASGRLCYIEQSTARGETFVNGWLILPVGSNLYLVFSILTTPEELPALQPALERAFETINLRAAGEIADRRLSRFDAGREFLAKLSPDQLRSLVGLEQWFRIYRPNSSGDGETEIGYSLLEVLEARRGELNPARAESSYSPTEQVPGLLVRMRGRIVGDAARNLFYDSIATYWLAWDLSEEAWDVRGTQRQGAAERTEAETGFRMAPTLGDPRRLLTVIHDNSITQLRDTNEWAVPDVYLSQALASVLARLLPMDKRDPIEYAWYFYNFSQASPQLTQRIDRWAPAGDGTGNWVLRSQLSVEAPAIESIYSPERELVRTRRADGVLTEPTTLEQLRRIWERKGLPMGRSPTSGRR